MFQKNIFTNFELFWGNPHIVSCHFWSSVGRSVGRSVGLHFFPLIFSHHKTRARGHTILRRHTAGRGHNAVWLGASPLAALGINFSIYRFKNYWTKSGLERKKLEICQIYFLHTFMSFYSILLLKISNYQETSILLNKIFCFAFLWFI